MLEKFSPENIKNYTQSQLNVLCDELRTTIYDTVMRCGGHLASNLGSVESTVALFYVFDFPNDKIIFDVGLTVKVLTKLSVCWMVWNTLYIQILS